MTTTDETAAAPAVEAPPVYRPRSARAHVSASQPTGLVPSYGPAAPTAPKR